MNKFITEINREDYKHCHKCGNKVGFTYFNNSGNFILWQSSCLMCGNKIEWEEYYNETIQQ